MTRKHLSKFTQNYPTERKDYGQAKARDPAEGSPDTIDQAIENSENQPQTNVRSITKRLKSTSSRMVHSKKAKAA